MKASTQGLGMNPRTFTQEPKSPTDGASVIRMEYPSNPESSHQQPKLPSKRHSRVFATHGGVFAE